MALTRQRSVLPPAPARPRAFLYCHTSMAPLAEHVVEDINNTVGPAVRSEHSLGLEGSKRTRLEEQHDGQPLDRLQSCIKDIRWGLFEDGFPNIFIEKVKEMAGRDVVFLASFHNTEVIFHQIAVIYALPRYLARTLTIVLPYFATGTMERIDSEGQIASAMTLASMLSYVPLCANGPATIIIFDIHALQERFYFGPQVIPRLETAMPLLLDILAKICETNGSKRYAIAFPDDGAFKRFNRHFSAFETIICSKVREGNKRVVKLKEGDAKGRDVIIVDDLIKTGGTILECAKTVQREGARSISAFVTHAVFPQDSWKRFLDSPISKFWVTDSVPTIAEELRKQGDPFEVLSLSPLIAKCLVDYELMFI